MMYVYILRSLSDPNRFYSGVTSDVEARLKEHNAGEVFHTAKYKPWTIKNYIAFENREKAFAFERYLKSGSGRAFVKKHF